MEDTLQKKLDSIIEIVQKKEFLESSSLGNEIGFYIFDYDPAEEMIVRAKTKYIKRHFKSDPKVVIKEFDLFDMLYTEINERKVLEKIYDREKNKDFKSLMKPISAIVKPQVLNEKIVKGIKDCNVVFVTGVGKAWPFIRSHSMLNNLHAIVDKKPLIMFYPGVYDKVQLRLFDKFKDDNYYRAFRLFDKF